MTNTAAKTPADCAAKMKRMGFAQPREDHIYTAASVLGKYVKRKYPDVKKAFVVGMPSLREMVEAQGIEVIGAEQHILDPTQIVTEVVYDTMELDSSVDAVLYGIDAEFTH